MKSSIHYIITLYITLYTLHTYITIIIIIIIIIRLLYNYMDNISLSYSNALPVVFGSLQINKILKCHLV